MTSWPDSDPLVTGVGGTELMESGGAYTSVAWNDTYDQALGRVLGRLDRPGPAGQRRRHVRVLRPAVLPERRQGRHRRQPRRARHRDERGLQRRGERLQQLRQPGQAGWSLTCGTSEATPEFAAIVALADQVAGHWLGLINPTLYKLLAEHAPGLVDVTSGNNTVSFYHGGSRPPTPAHRHRLPGPQGLQPGDRRRHGQRQHVRLRAGGRPGALTA